MWALGVATLYVGAIVFDAIESISTFVLILLVLVSPWTAIMLVGLALRRGRYHPDDLYGFARPADRGRYWFTGGSTSGPWGRSRPRWSSGCCSWTTRSTPARSPAWRAGWT
ncbi:hypothetical protein GCM10027612_34170 [Microbispora bryophytorum subsp. camponoti]